MKKNVLINYVEHQLTAAQKDIGAYKKKQQVEQLHHLRVAIKKTKAILKFAEELYAKKTSAKTLKPLFANAGKIRELHINLKILSSLTEAPKRIITDLKKKAINPKREFLNKTPQHIKAIKKFKKYLDLPKQLPGKKKLKHYFNA